MTTSVPSPSTSLPTRAAPPHTGSTWGAGRITLIVVGALLGLVGVAVLVGGVAVAVVDNTRDRDGFIMSAPGRLQGNGYALTVPDLTVTGFGGWPVDARATAGTARVTATSRRPVFIGIGPSDRVAAYLSGVQHDVLEDVSTSPFRVTYRPVSGGAPAGPPAAQSFWVATSSGDTTQVLDWATREGDWTVVLMNADGSRQVDAATSVGATLPVMHGLAIALCVGGALAFLLGLALVLIAVVSHGRQPQARPRPRLSVSSPTREA